MGVTSTFSQLYTALRVDLRDPVGGTAEGSSPRWTLAEKKGAINQAIRDAFPTIQVPYTDESITLLDQVFEYAPPETLLRNEDLHEIWVQSESGEAWKRQGGGWRVKENDGILTLYIDEVWNANKKLRLIYSGPPVELSGDTDTTIVPMPFILARAKFYLHSMAGESASLNDMNAHLQRANSWYQISEAMLARYGLGNSDVSEGATQFSNWASVE